MLIKLTHYTKAYYLNRPDKSDPLNIMRVVGVSLFGFFVQVTWHRDYEHGPQPIRWRCGNMRRLA